MAEANKTLTCTQQILFNAVCTGYGWVQQRFRADWRGDPFFSGGASKWDSHGAGAEETAFGIYGSSHSRGWLGVGGQVRWCCWLHWTAYQDSCGIRYDVTKLRDKTAITVTKFKQSSECILGDLQGTYLPLLSWLPFLIFFSITSFTHENQTVPARFGSLR